MADVKLLQATESTWFPSPARDTTWTVFNFATLISFETLCCYTAHLWLLFLRVMLLCVTHLVTLVQRMELVCPLESTKKDCGSEGEGCLSRQWVFGKMQRRWGVAAVSLTSFQNTRCSFRQGDFPWESPLWLWRNVPLAIMSSRRVSQKHARVFLCQS